MVGEGGGEHLLGICDGEMTEEAEDQDSTHAQLPLRTSTGGGEATHHGGIGNSATGVRLGVEGDFGVDNTVGVGFDEVFPGELLEIRGVDEDAHAGIVVGEEGVKGGKGLVGGEEGGGGCIGGSGGEGDGISGGECEEEGGREGAFEVQVVFAFGKGDEERVEWRAAHYEGWDKEARRAGSMGGGVRAAEDRGGAFGGARGIARGCWWSMLMDEAVPCMSAMVSAFPLLLAPAIFLVY